MTAQETFLPILDPFSLGGFWDKRLKCTTHMNDDGSGDNTSLGKRDRWGKEKFEDTRGKKKP